MRRVLLSPLLQVSRGSHHHPLNDERSYEERIVSSLAEKWHVCVGDMMRLYEHERSSLAQGAHITQFLHIFVTRNVLEVLRQRRGSVAGSLG